MRWRSSRLATLLVSSWRCPSVRASGRLRTGSSSAGSRSNGSERRLRLSLQLAPDFVLDGLWQGFRVPTPGVTLRRVGQLLVRKNRALQSQEDAQSTLKFIGLDAHVPLRSSGLRRCENGAGL